VQIASHSVNHIDLTKSNSVEVERELKDSKNIIENKISQDCNIFTYPYGAFNKDVKQMLKKYYEFDIAIGSIYNFNINNTIYRIYSDDLKDCCYIFNNNNKLKYLLRTFKYLIEGRLK